MIIDGVVLFAVVLFGIALSIVSPPWIPFLVFLGYVGFEVYFLSRNGQTLGKRFLNIAIVRKDTGENPGFIRCVLLRFVVSTLLGVIPFYALVDILLILREDRRCLHDFLAGTIVVQA